MSDRQLRQLERRFRASRSVEDEAAWLRARVQAGELERSTLELAAYLGHQPARTVRGTLEPSPRDPDRWDNAWLQWLDKTPADYEQIHLWASWLSRWSPHLCARASIAATRAALAPTRLVLLESSEASMIDPTPARADACEALAASLEEREGRCDETFVAMATARHCCWAIQQEEPDPPDWASSEVASWVAANLLPPAQVVTVVRAELAPFALGYSDPVRERVEARQGKVAGD